MRAGAPKCIHNEVKALDFISSEIIQSGKMHMMLKKSKATNSAGNHFELLTNFVFVLVSQGRVSTSSLNFVGQMIRFESGYVICLNIESTL